MDTGGDSTFPRMSLFSHHAEPLQPPPRRAVLRAEASTLPPPEAWGWELDFLINRLCDRLDICKAYHVLLDSLEAYPKEGRWRKLEYMRYGAQHLSRYLIQKIGDPPPDLPTTALATFQTPTLAALQRSCGLDDVNLVYVFDVLRLAELVEGSHMALTREAKAETLCAVLGELVAVRHDFLREARDDARHVGTMTFLQATEQMLLDFIAECGRDRATYMKEIYSHLPIPPPRPMFHNRQSSPILTRAMLYPPMVTESKGDVLLERLLLSGSLQSQWQRLQQLWASTHDVYSSTRASVENKIRLAVIHAVRHMSRYRRLLFTRFLEMLSAPSMALPSSSLETEAMNINATPPDLAQVVFQAFIDSGEVEWPYESEEQRRAITRASNLTQSIKDAVMGILQVPDSIHFLTSTPLASEDSVNVLPFLGKSVSDILEVSSMVKRYTKLPTTRVKFIAALRDLLEAATATTICEHDLV